MFMCTFLRVLYIFISRAKKRKVGARRRLTSSFWAGPGAAVPSKLGVGAPVGGAGGLSPKGDGAGDFTFFLLGAGAGTEAGGDASGAGGGTAGGGVAGGGVAGGGVAGGGVAGGGVAGGGVAGGGVAGGGVAGGGDAGGGELTGGGVAGGGALTGGGVAAGGGDCVTGGGDVAAGVGGAVVVVGGGAPDGGLDWVGGEGVLGVELGEVAGDWPPTPAITMQTNPTKNAALRSIVISLIVRTLSLLSLRTVSTHSANKTEREREREFFFSFLFFAFLFMCVRESVCVFLVGKWNRI